ncbi:hypothetical protein GCM10010349_62330 [Streptomyces flavofungini]|nr:hypothetical protein GCM10010349_62330 [Streptomyces flavofungini]
MEWSVGNRPGRGDEGTPSDRSAIVAPPLLLRLSCEGPVCDRRGWDGIVRVRHLTRVRMVSPG